MKESNDKFTVEIVNISEDTTSVEAKNTKGMSQSEIASKLTTTLAIAIATHSARVSKMMEGVEMDDNDEEGYNDPHYVIKSTLELIQNVYLSYISQ